MTLPPHAPWRLQGEILVGVARCRPDGPLPDGLRAAPGPSVIGVARYSDSPVGPYLELAVAQPARLAVRPAWCVTTMAVTSLDARVGGVVNWGFPKELATLTWSAAAEGVEVRWEERGVVLRGQPMRWGGLPVVLPVRCLQHRADGPVVVPGRVRGWLRPARIEVDAPGDDPLAPFAGRHRGMHVSGLRLVIDPARHPTGASITLRAPLRAPEPALSSTPPGA